ncbi:MAG: ankyrin repeat domain-containing protein [Campylobacterales bacterium]
MAEIKFNFDDTIRTVPIDPKDMPEHLGTDDPVVLKTSWNSLSSGSQNFKSHRLVSVGDSRLEFQRSAQSLLFSLLFMTAGIVPIGLVFSGASSPLPMVLVGLFFIGAGLFLLLSGKKRIVIDRTMSALWEGKEEPAKVINPSAVDGYRSLKDVHAVQLLKSHVPGDSDSSSYYNHEINLIFADGKRIALVGHGNEQTITNQAWKLSEFLAIPLWDGRSDILAPSLFSNFSFGKPFEYMMSLFHLYSRLKTIAAVVIIAVVLFLMFFSQSAEADKKVNLLSVTWQERQRLEPQYTAELFDLVKQPTVSVVAFDRILESGLDINAKDALGRTPLYYAVKHKQIDYVNKLLRKGADIHVRDNNGIGLIDLLDKKRDAHLYQMLVYAQLQASAKQRGKEVYGASFRTAPDGTLTVTRVQER